MKLIFLLVTLPDLAFSCLNGYNTWLDGRCFRVEREKKVTYTEALAACTRNGMENAILPSIKSIQENTQFFTVLNQFDYQYDYQTIDFWLGLTCNGEKFVWGDGSEANYTNFADDYKCDTSTNGTRHFYVGSDRRWYESGNTQIFAIVVCEALEKIVTPCDFSFDLVKTDNSVDTCVSLQNTPTSWYEAEKNCQQKGANLSLIHDKQLNDYILGRAVASGFIGGIHIGIKKDLNGKYSWTAGSGLGYDNFVDGFPNDFYGECTAMQNTFLPGQWMNVDCYRTNLPYVCTKPAFTTPKETPQPAGCPVKTQYAPGDEMTPGAFSCDYLLLAPNFKQMASCRQAEVEITVFESNLCCDRLTIYDGLFGTDIIETLSGSYSHPMTFLATSNAIRMQWNSTSGAHVKGFRAKLKSAI